jgi:F0F1-type ATP synthase delta subunit
LKSASLQYANALADIALQQGAAAPVVQQLGDLTAAYSQSAELRNVFSSPAVSKDEKRAIATTSARSCFRRFLSSFKLFCGSVRELPRPRFFPR